MGYFEMMNQPSLFSNVLSVSQLNRLVRALIDQDELLQDLWVEGEVSNLRQPSSGHVYFTLKDEAAAVRCVIWRSQLSRMHFGLNEGTAVQAHGHLDVYEREGEYQLYVDDVLPLGEGALYQEFVRRKAKLEAQGLFDPGRKRPLPAFPRTIALVTSSSGAAYHDVVNTLQKRYPLGRVCLVPCAVQGDEAPGQIVRALHLANEAVSADVILLVRGGGSLEDLWAFNDEEVVQAVAESEVPVVTGVGHETDFTLVDFAADARAPTPTGAAVMATPDVAELGQSLRHLTVRLAGAMQTIIRSRSDRLHRLERDLSFMSPARHVQEERQRLDSLELRLLQAGRSGLSLRRLKLSSLAGRLSALDPSAILGRGYALVRNAQGLLLKSVEGIRLRDELEIQMADGHVQATVLEVNKTGGS